MIRVVRLGRALSRSVVWTVLCLLTGGIGCVVDNPHFSLVTPGELDGSPPDDVASSGNAGNDPVGGVGGTIATGGNAAGGNAAGGSASGGAGGTMRVDASVITVDAMPPADAFMPFGGCTSNCPKTRVTAAIGDCICLNAPDPDFCEVDTGQGEAAVDLVDNGNGSEVAIFLRFDPPATLRSGSFMRITLELVVTQHPFAPGPQSGAVWQVSSFTRADLFRRVPAKIGTRPIAADLGPVGSGQVVRWTLPNQVFTGGPIYLGLFTTNSDGINYWNARSNNPPVLVFE